MGGFQLAQAETPLALFLAPALTFVPFQACVRSLHVA